MATSHLSRALSGSLSAFSSDFGAGGVSATEAPCLFSYEYFLLGWHKCAHLMPARAVANVAVQQARIS
jgi:hypothetical protein